MRNVARSRPSLPVAAILVTTLACLEILAVTFPAMVFAAAAETAAAPADDAYHLEAGSIARQRIVALGRDLRIDGEAYSHAVALSGTARVAGIVGGDLIVLGGDAVLEAGAAVGGDVYVLGGRIEAAENVEIGGRSVAYPEASDLWVTLMEGPALGAPATSGLVIGARLALLAFWCFVLLLLFAVARRELESTSEAIRHEPFRNFFVGLVGVSAMVLTAVFFSAFSGAFLGLPLLVLVAVVALVLRFWGMVAIFHALGAWFFGLWRKRQRSAGHRRAGRRVVAIPPALTLAFWGLLALGVVKFLPYVGVWTWSVATFIGVGGALTTKFGRREAWFEG